MAKLLKHFSLQTNKQTNNLVADWHLKTLNITVQIVFQNNSESVYWNVACWSITETLQGHFLPTIAGVKEGAEEACPMLATAMVMVEGTSNKPFAEMLCTLSVFGPKSIFVFCVAPNFLLGHCFCLFNIYLYFFHNCVWYCQSYKSHCLTKIKSVAIRTTCLLPSSLQLELELELWTLNRIWICK